MPIVINMAGMVYFSSMFRYRIAHQTNPIQIYCHGFLICEIREVIIFSIYNPKHFFAASEAILTNMSLNAEAVSFPAFSKYFFILFEATSV